MNDRFFYLAGPYTHPEAAVQGDRVELLTMAAAMLMSAGHVIYSPITHGHQIAQHFSRPQSHDFWLGQCLPLLHEADALIIVPLDGWRNSLGIAKEIDYAKGEGLPIYILQAMPEGFEAHIERVSSTEASAAGWSILDFS